MNKVFYSTILCLLLAGCSFNHSELDATNSETTTFEYQGSYDSIYKMVKDKMTICLTGNYPFMGSMLNDIHIEDGYAEITYYVSHSLASNMAVKLRIEDAGSETTRMTQTAGNMIRSIRPGIVRMFDKWARGETKCQPFTS